MHPLPSPAISASPILLLPFNHLPRGSRSSRLSSALMRQMLRILIWLVAASLPFLCYALPTPLPVPGNTRSSNKWVDRTPPAVDVQGDLIRSHYDRLDAALDQLGAPERWSKQYTPSSPPTSSSDTNTQSPFAKTLRQLFSADPTGDGESLTPIGRNQIVTNFVSDLLVSST